MKKEVKLYKTTSVSFATEPDAVFFVKGVNETVVRTYITTSDGQAIPLKDLSGGGSGSGIQFLVSDDSSISITGTATSKNIQVSSALQTLISSALQNGDAVSSLLNDAGYITLADVPTFNPSDYDLSDFTNSSSDPFVKQSEITSGATNLGYTASPTNGIVTSDTGSDATIPLADNTNAGLLSPAEKSEIATAIQPSDLGAVATSNDYNDLDNIPVIPTPLTNHSELNLNDGTNPHGTTASDVGLGNANNTSDADKPISTATQLALNGKQDVLGFTPENIANKNDTTLNNSSTEYPTSNLVKLSIEGALTKDIIEKGLIWQVPSMDGTYGTTGNTGQYLRLTTSPITQNIVTTQEFGMSVGVIETTAVAGTSGGLRRNGGIDLQLYSNIISVRDFTVNNTISNDCRIIVGFSKNYQFAFPSNAEPTTFTECILVAKLSTSNNLHIVHNNNTGTATSIDLGVNFPADNNLYKYRMILIKESASSYYVQVIRTTLSNGVLLASSIYHLTSDLPTAGGLLQQIMWINNNASAVNMKLGDYGLIIKKV